MAARVLSREEIEAIDLPEGAPTRAGLVREAVTFLQPARLVFATPKLLTAPKGDGRSMIALPGYKAPDASMLPIRGFLENRNHQTNSWGLGVNRGDVEGTRDRMVPRVQALAEQSGRAVNLLGWSLGGVVAREIARLIPDAVHHVATYGSPIIGGPTHTVGAADYDPSERDRIYELQQYLDENEPIATPMTCIFTRNDNIVDWRSCIDRTSLDVTMIEVDSTHVGLGADPDVWLAVADAFAA